MHLDGAAHHINDVLGNRHAQTGALNLAHRGGTLPLEGLEDPLREFLAHADTGVLHPDLIQSLPLWGIGKLCHTDGNRAAGGCEFNRVGQQVQEHLIQAGFVAEHILIGHIQHIHIQLQLLGVNLTADDGLNVMKHVGQVHFLLLQLDFAAFDAAHVQHIVDQAQQMVAGREDFRQIILNLFRIRYIGNGKGRKPDDCVHGRADIVRHTAEERALCPVGALRGVDSVLQIPADLLFLGAVGENQNVLFASPNLPAQGGNMEPAHLSGLLMNVFPIPFRLLPGMNVRELVQNQDGLRIHDQPIHYPNIFPCLCLRDAHQLLNVGTDVFHPQVGGVQHGENIVHITGQNREQFLPVENFPVLFVQALSVSSDERYQQQRKQSRHNAGRQQHGAGLKPAHTGIHHSGRHNAQNRPVLKTRRLIYQIIGFPLNREHHCPGISRLEILLKRGKLPIRHAAGFLKHGQNIVDTLHVRAAVIQHHPTVRQNCEGAGLSIEG